MIASHLQSAWEPGSPIYLQLYRRYREAIASGQLQPGDRVPSVRSLASELNLARGTVETAYQMLISEGYLLPRGAAGTVVSPRLTPLPEPLPAPSDTVVLPASGQPQRNQILPFQLGIPALDAFPRKTWARLAGRHLRNLDITALGYPDPAGYEPLRQAIATYLGVSRGIICDHQQIFITTGYRGALDLICRTLLNPGDLGWFEEPGYLIARQFLQRAGMQLHAVPVDAEGLQVDEGLRLGKQARFAVVTPSHQSPMGAALSLPRRLALLEWASQQQSWIIEDDYDSEFRYQGRPLPALKSLDHDGRVLYTGTFSKVLFPGLQLAYLVVPTAQITLFREALKHLPGPGALLPQATVAEFMEQGHFARHLRKMRSLYAERRHYLVSALEQQLGRYLQVQSQAGGIQVLAHLLKDLDDRSLAESARDAGLALTALNDWRQQAAHQGGLVMGFSNFTTADEAQQAVERLSRILR